MYDISERRYLQYRVVIYSFSSVMSLFRRAAQIVHEMDTKIRLQSMHIARHELLLFSGDKQDDF
jgi:hypothetical protein